MWNHRVVRRPVETVNGITYWYAIHEAFYQIDDPADGKPDGITVEPVDVSGDEVADMEFTLKSMARALELPVIDYETRERV
jgi:hypothetical protein